MARRALWLPLSVVAGLVAGGVLAGVVATLDVGGHRREEPLTGAAAAEAFLDAWRESRLATWVIEGTFTRTTATGRSITSEIHVAQRPPDRLSLGIGSVTARLGDRRLSCTTDPAGELRCRDAGRAPPYEEEVAQEVETLATYVQGAVPLYEVTADSDGCFDLELLVEMPAPPYGEEARFCFDEETRAPTLAEIRRTEAVDVRRSTRVSAEVSDEDLAPPPGRAA
jgi:hypothetical protein